MNEAKRLNIQSTAKTTHHLFGRISYKPWYAIAEFVDNSTQSFFSNKERFDNQKRVDVIVQYKNDEKVLTVTDNAFGMDLDELSVALNLEGGLENKTGRNEFGVGMKTAAGWFGKKWSVTTTKYNSGKQYVAIVDIDNLENEIVIYEEDVPLEQHGTTIRIEKITKGLTAPRTVSKIKDVLSSMYRRDINSGEVYIEYNRDPIYFEDYPVLSNFRDTEWKKDVNFEFEFEGKLYHVDGFIAIMDPGSFVNAGLALFRRNRVIIGGPDMNYKPAEIFGQQQSQKSLKLFGELNMDDFPVNQAKDGFVWDDGLEDEFISCLKENIQDYIKIADISKQDRAKEEMYSQKTTEKVSEEVKTALEQVQNSFEEQENTPSQEVEEQQETDFHDEQQGTNDDEESSIVKQFREELAEKNSIDDEKVVGSQRHYDVPLNAIKSLSIDVDWTINHKKYWIDIKDSEENTDQLYILINIDHPFFRPYSNQDDFKIVIEKFVISFVVAENTAKMNSDKDGYILYKSIRDKMNEYLISMGE